MTHTLAHAPDQAELMRQLALIGAPQEPSENTPCTIYKFAEAEARQNARFPQQMQVSEGGDASGCLVRLLFPSPAPSSTPSAPSENSQITADLKEMLARLEEVEKAEEAERGGGPMPTPALIPAPPMPTQTPTPAPAPTVTVTVTIAGTTQTTPKPKRAANAPNMPPAWLRLSKLDRLRAAIAYCEAVGGVAVTLNLHPAKDAAYTSGHLKTGIVRLFRDALNRRLDAAGIVGLPYWLQFEVSPWGRLHLHGVIDTHDRDQAQVDAIKLAMRQAAGQILGKGAGRQLCVRPITKATGWARYMRKALKMTLAQLKQDVPPIASHSMSRRAGKHHDTTRRLRVHN